MSDTPDEPLPEEVEPLIRSMRADVLGPDEVDALARGVEAALAGGAGGGAPPAPGMGLGAIAAGTGAIAVAVVIGVMTWSGPSGEDARAPREEVVAHEGSAEAETEAETGTEVVRERVEPIAEPAPTVARQPSEVRAPAEHTLLADARRRLATEPAAALALASQHRRAYPDGTLALEREMIAIDALVALGREPAARRRAAELVARWPASAYASRVRERGLVDR